jgi:hypothetical protein
MSECRNRHDDGGEILFCDKSSGNHRRCSGWSDRAGGHVDWDNPVYTAPKTTQDAPAASSRLQAMANRVNGAQAGKEGSERAAANWTPAQRQMVESAITEVATRQDEFTTDDLWTVLGQTVPKTAGMAAILRQATSRGFIEPTDRYADSTRDRADHDQGRRLRVWRSRMR